MKPAQPRTCRLIERQPRICRLTRAEVAFLLAQHSTHLEILPTDRPARYRVTALGHVGTIVTPSLRLVIRPKIARANSFHLLDPDHPPHVVDDAAQVGTGTEALDFLAMRFATLLAERSAFGLQRGYVERVATGSFLQGRLDTAAQLRGAPVSKTVLHSQFEDHSADIPCNQVPRAVAELLLRSSLVTESTRNVVRQALTGYEQVQSASLTAETFAQAVAVTDAYRPLLDLAHLLAEGLAPGETAGSILSPAFLLDMDRLFESYLTRCVTRGLDGHGEYSVGVQPLHRVNRAVAGQPDLLMRPDLLLVRAGVPAVVIDAKWKQLPESSVIPEDVSQVLAYCAALGVGQGILVYPGRRDRTWNYELSGSPIRLTLHTLRVVGPARALQRSMRRLLRDLRSS
jgi:5-methylcytosine-specific restriction enzyme subunit McrC